MLFAGCYDVDCAISDDGNHGGPRILAILLIVQRLSVHLELSADFSILC